MARVLLSHTRAARIRSCRAGLRGRRLCRLTLTLGLALRSLRLLANRDPPRLHLGLLSRRGGDLEGARRELTHALTLLEREEPARLLLFGGGFGRDALVALCRAELRAAGGAS